MIQENIRLYEAMTNTIHCRVRAWEVPCLHIEVENLPETAKVTKTFVFKLFEDMWQVGIEYTIENDPSPCMDAIAEFSTLEEVQRKYPQLFELEGDLYALS